MEDINIKYVSAEKYSKSTGLGVEEVKRMCRIGELPHYMTEKGHYKVIVTKDGSISKDKYEILLKENTELKTKLNSLKKILEVS